MLAVAAFSGAVLLVISDFTTLFHVHTAAGVTVPGGTVKGHSNHSWAMLVIGLAALPLAYSASRLSSRPAMAALAGLGVIAVILSIGFDLPDATGTNTLARTFEDATGTPSTGFYLETLGGVLLLLGGGGGLLLSAPGRERRAARAAAEQAERDEEAREAAAARRAEARRRRTQR